MKIGSFESKYFLEECFFFVINKWHLEFSAVVSLYIIIFRTEALVTLGMKGNSDFFFSTALGKGPYKLLSYVNGEFVMAAKLANGFVFPVREDDITPEHIVGFMLTSGLYKPKAHGKVVVM